MSGDPLVTSIRSIELRVPDLDATSAFYTEVWGLSEVARGSASRYFRTTGSEHHAVVLHAGSDAALLRVNFGAPSRAALDAAYARVAGAGLKTLGEPKSLGEPGNGYGFSFVDGEDRTFGISSDVGIHHDTALATDRPFKLSHVVLNSDNVEAATEMFIGVLGFRLRDSTSTMDFLGCNRDHHSIAFTRFGTNGVNHIAFEVPSIDALMRGAGRMKQHGHPIEWGVGRHGPGDNVFAYFLDPNNFAIEYTTEMEQIDDASYVPGTPADWNKRVAKDAWNLADPPSERFRYISSHLPNAKPLAMQRP